MATEKVSGFFLFVLSLFIVSCGGSGVGSQRTDSPPRSDPHEKGPMQESGEEKMNLYRAVLKPLNPATTAETNGVVMIRIDGDEFVVEQTVTNAPAGIRHFQAIMTGDSCDIVDENGDGYFDLAEGSKVFGKRLIPLDSQLDSQLEGADFGPIANAASAYVYRRSTSLSKLLSDLTAVDPNQTDDLVKLESDEALTLSKRVVVVMGSSDSVPDSVFGNGTFFASEGLPIACGELTPMKNETDL